MPHKACVALPPSSTFLEATDKMFPAPKGRNGRHYQRQHLSGVLVTFRQLLAAEFASRNCTYTAAVPATE